MNKHRLEVVVAHDNELVKAVHLLTNYRFLSALRGPDISYMDGVQRRTGTVLKEHVTARLRAIIQEYVPCQGLINAVPLTEDNVQAVIDAVNALPREHQDQFRHFIAHLSDALAEVINNRIWGGRGGVLFTVLVHAFEWNFCTVDAAAKHLDYLKGGL